MIEKRNAIRVLVVDDHPVVRRGLVALVDAEPDLQIVGEADSGEAALRAFRGGAPDVALVDLRLPDMTGVELAAQIRRELPDAKLVLLTTFEDDEQIARALEVGMLGVLLKSLPTPEILAALRAAHAGRRYLPGPIAALVAERLYHPVFTPKELDVLRLLVRGGSNKELGERLGISAGTVKTHLAQIFKKLGVRDRTTAIATALKRGLVRLG